MRAPQDIPDQQPRTGHDAGRGAVLSPAGQRPPFVTWLVRAAGATAVLIGCVYLGLWLAGLPQAWSARGTITMKTNMALAQVLAGAALLLLGEARVGRAARAAAIAASALVLALGALTLGEHLLGVDLGIDQLLAAEPRGQPGTASPNRMGPPGAMGLTVIGAGLFALAWRRPAALFLGIAACCVVLVPAVGLVYQIDPLHSVPYATAIAWPAVVALFALGAGLALAHRREGVVPLLWRDDPGGVLLRRMVVPAVLLPIVLGLVPIYGEWLGLYDRQLGTGVFAVALVIVFMLLLWRSAERLSASAAEREVAAGELRRTVGALLESEQRFRTLADAMPQLVWTARPDGIVDYYNCRSAELAGIERRADGSWRWVPVLHPDDLPGTVAAWKHAVATGEMYQVEHRVQLARGAYRWYLSRAVPVRDASGNVVKWYGTATDIHDQKEAQEALRDADRRKDEFLGMLSHELRNPLAPIRNSLYILDHAEPDGDHARRAKEVANRQLSHLTRLVDDLLDVTRIARGKIQLRRTDVDLADLARRAGEDHRALMQERRLDLVVTVPGEPVVVHADETRVAQIIGNLLHNAAKFTPPGGQVALSVAREGEAAVIGVRDTGTGIEPQLLASVFEPFIQAKQTLARSEGGLGLGLALVKGLVAFHGGEVAASSEGAGRGTEFRVKLPLAPASASAGADERAGPPRAARGRRRVLVVDDNRDAAETLAELVQMFGHDAEVAFDGPSALAKAREHQPDVVLCDIGLPGMDGYAVARELRAAGRNVRVIAVSGYAHPEDLARAAEAGFHDHIAKPPEPERIEQVLA